MNTNLHARTLMILAAVAAAGCATTRNKALDEKLAKVPPVTSRQDLRNVADSRIDESDLTGDQKQQLSILRSRISTQLDEITGQSLKLRSVLVEEILSPSYSLDEVDLIKSRLKKLENQRLSLIFDGVEQANHILGRQAPQHIRVMRELLEGRTIRD